MTAPYPTTSTQIDSPAMAKLKAFYRKHQFVVEALDKGADQFDVVGPMDPYYGAPTIVKPTTLKSEEEVRIANEQLVFYVWHFGEYIKLVAQHEKGMSEDQSVKLVNNHVKRHQSLQIMAYLANMEKHAELTRKNPGDHLKPRYGQLMTMFPTSDGMMGGVIGSGVVEMQGTFVGPAIQTVEVVAEDGRRLGHVRWLVDEAAKAWLDLIENKLGVRLN